MRVPIPGVELIPDLLALVRGEGATNPSVLKPEETSRTPRRSRHAKRLTRRSKVNKVREIPHSRSRAHRALIPCERRRCDEPKSFEASRDPD